MLSGLMSAMVVTVDNDQALAARVRRNVVDRRRLSG